MITEEDYVSLETAKLLKEKGFNWPCRAYYNDGSALKEDVTVPNDWSNSSYFNHTSAPTLQMAMKYLRKVHNLMVSPYALSHGYYFEIFDLTNRDITGCKPLYKVGIPNKEDILNTYEEAVEAALKYLLKNLI